jgi:hypothetical protein
MNTSLERYRYINLLSVPVLELDISAGRPVAQAVSRWLPTAAAGFEPK